MKTLLILFILIHVSMNAQDVAIDAQYFTATEEKVYLKDVAQLSNSDRVLLLQSHGKQFPVYVQKLDTAGKLLKETKFDIENRKLENLFIFKDKIYVLYHGYNSSGKNYEYYIGSANTSDLKFATKKIISFAGKHEYFYGFGRYADPYMSFLITNVSKDKSHFCIYVDIGKLKTDPWRKIYFFDTEKQEAYYEYDYANEEEKQLAYLYKDVMFSDDNTALLVCDVKARLPKGPNQHYEIHKISKEDGLKSQVLGTEESIVRRLTFVPKETGLALVGFYGTNKKSLWQSGACYFEVDPSSLEVEIRKFHPFSKQFYIDKFGKDKVKDIASIDDLGTPYLLPGGDIILSAEDVSSHSVNNTALGHGDGPTFSHSYLDIAVVKFANNGDLKWMRNIVKDQNGFNTFSTLSHKAAVKGNDLYFFLNADKNVKDMGKGRMKFEHNKKGKSDFMVIKLDDQGTLTYKSLVDSNEQKIIANPQFAVDTEEANSFYMFGQDEKNKMFAKVQF